MEGSVSAFHDDFGLYGPMVFPLARGAAEGTQVSLAGNANQSSRFRIGFFHPVSVSQCAHRNRIPRLSRIFNGSVTIVIRVGVARVWCNISSRNKDYALRRSIIIIAIRGGINRSTPGGGSA